MKNDHIGALLIRLEKRIIILEKMLKITPEKTDLIHPKALRQAKAREKK
jgi:hypothetical protein